MSETHAGYKYLKTYKLAAIVYDLTVVFCERWVDRFSRTQDQMVQAARSGKQNIVEGSKGKSLKTYIRLCSVARASLEELLEDYHDFARQHGLKKFGRAGRSGPSGGLEMSGWIPVPRLSPLSLLSLKTKK